MQSKWKRLIPARVKETLRQAQRDLTLNRAVRHIASLRGNAPDAKVLVDLLKGWGNEGYAAIPDYLQEVGLAAAQTQGPILECGSGASTLLLNLLAAARGIEVWSLEHSPEWHSHIRSTLRRYDLPDSKVCLSPLRDYGSFSWYDFPTETMPRDFRLVICDGPPGSTPGGRYGLLPVCHSHLAKEARIFLDDANRPEEEKALKRWATEFHTASELRQMSAGSFAIVTFPH